MGLEKYKNIYLILILSLLILIPKNVDAASPTYGVGSTTGSAGASARTYYLGTDYSNVESEISGINVASYSDGHQLNWDDNPDDGVYDPITVAGNYYLRYDITSLGINENNLLRMQGWGVIKDYNNGVLNSYAPTYYLNIIDVSDNKEYFYKYVADASNTNGINMNELNMTGSISGDTEHCGVRDYESSSTFYKRSYKNTEFAFNDIQLDPIISNHNFDNGELRIVLNMMIVINGDGNECNKTRSDWFRIGVYDVDGKKVSDENPNYIINTTDKVNLIASFAGGFTQNATYTISEIKESSDGGWTKKFQYKLKDGPSYNDQWAYATWVQNNSSFEIIYDPVVAPTCNDASYAASNQEECCVDNKIADESLRNQICCSGTYGVQYAYNNPNKCCDVLPETCCSNEDFINNNWDTKFSGDNAWKGNICCSKEMYTYPGTSYTFHTFYSANLIELQEKCETPNSTITAKICTSDYTNTKETYTDITINGTTATGTKIVSVTLPEGANISEFSTSNVSNIGFYVDTSASSSEITDYSNFITQSYKIRDVNTSQNKITLEYKYKFEPGATQTDLLPGNYKIRIRFFVCYNLTDETPTSDCDDPKYNSENYAICIPTGMEIMNLLIHLILTLLVR